MTQLKEKALKETPKKAQKETSKETPTASRGFFQWRQSSKRQASKHNAAKSRRRIPRSLIYSLASLGAITLVVLAFRPAPLAVETGQVSEGPLQVTISAEGKTQVKERYVISAPVSGRLQRISVKVGDMVSQGDVLANIDPLPLNAQVRSAQAQLERLQAELAGVETQRPKSQEIAQAEAQMRSAEAKRSATAAQVEEAKAALAQAQRDRVRAQDLAAQGAISRQQAEAAALEETQQARSLENMQQQLESASAEATAAGESVAILRAEQRDPDYLVSAYNAQIAGAEAELINLADTARRTTISAPVSGSVLRIPESSARFVSAGEPLVEIGDRAELELVIDVLSADAVKITPGDIILVEQWGGAESLRATVKRIEPAAFTEVSALGVEEQRVNIVGAFSTTDPIQTQLSALHLGDGYRIEANIVIWETDKTLRVPVSALYRCDQGWCVFTVDNGRARSREITIGARSQQSAAVESGLSPGENVILHPQEQIESGRRVAFQ